MLGQLDSDYELTDDADGADVIVVNTCSFIQSATEESIETILEMAQKKGGCKLSKTHCNGVYGTTLRSEFGRGTAGG
jgi:ribosomal protein S12 methylthiotransferase